MGGESGESIEKKTVMINQQHHHVEVETSGSPSGSGVHVDDKCSGREKTLSLFVILLSIFSFGLLVFVSVSGPLSSLLSSNSSAGLLGICDSPECVEISYHALKAGNFEDNPCQDFYRYSCSKWQLENPVTTDQFFHAANINLIKERVDLRFKELLEVPNESGSKQRGKTRRSGGKVEDNVRAFYQSCLNFVNPEEKHLLGELVKSAGGYRWSDNWSEDEFDLTNVTLKFLLMNAAPLFDVMLDIDVKNRSRLAIIIDLPRPTSLVPSILSSGPERDQDYLLQVGSWMHRHRYHDNGGDRFKFRHHGNSTNASPSVVERHLLYKIITDNIENKRVNQLKGLVKKVCFMMKVSEEECNADINDISGIVETIQKAFLPRQRTRKLLKQQNLVYNGFTIETLESHLTGIDWRKLLGTLIGVYKDGKDGGKVNWNDILGTVYVSYPDYLRRLLTFIQFTNKRVLYNAMLMIYVRDVLNDLVDNRKMGKVGETTDAGHGEKEHSSSSSGGTMMGDEPRWKFCVHSTKSVFAMELSSLYLRSFQPSYLQSIRNDVESIFKMVKDSLKSFLNRSTWLDARSRINALRKIETLKGNFLAPSFYFREDYLDDSIKNIQIDPENFMGNVLLVYRVFREQLYTSFRTEVDEDRITWSFVTFPFIVNAFYIQQFNSIVIPLGFLSPPQYRLGAPKYINYATIALTIAHEALHALDGSGRDFNENGTLEKWISETRGFLREKSACIANQYSETFKADILFHQTKVLSQVDGNLTQNENMADIAGLQVAYNAYENYRNSLDKAARKQLELKLPGVNLSLDQVFFVSVAQAYCANISPMGYVFLLEMDEHTPHPERINGMVMNLPEFSKAFQCPLGSPMNPKHKCSLW